MQPDQAARTGGPSFAAERRELLASMDGEQLALYLAVLREWSHHLSDLEERVVAAEATAKKLRTGLDLQISEAEAALRLPETSGAVIVRPRGGEPRPPEPGNLPEQGNLPRAGGTPCAWGTVRVGEPGRRRPRTARPGGRGPR